MIEISIALCKQGKRKLCSLFDIEIVTVDKWSLTLRRIFFKSEMNWYGPELSNSANTVTSATDASEQAILVAICVSSANCRAAGCCRISVAFHCGTNSDRSPLRLINNFESYTCDRKSRK